MVNHNQDKDDRKRDSDKETACAIRDAELDARRNLPDFSFPDLGITVVGCETYEQARRIAEETLEELLADGFDPRPGAKWTRPKGVTFFDDDPGLKV